MAKVSNLKDFKLLKENKVLHEETIFVKDIVLGSHPIALKLLKKLSQNDSKEEVRLIHEFEYKATFDFRHPRLLRGEGAYSWLKEKYPHYGVSDEGWVTKFYKDGEKREFGGRVKPHEVKEEEKFFCEKAFSFSAQDFYGDMTDYAQFESKHIKAFIKKIIPLEKNELATKEHFEVLLTDGRRFQCENLYCTFSPLKLVELLDKDKLDLFPAALYSYAKNLKPLPSLYVSMTLKGEWEKDLSTLLVPQSQTHEWGSFVVEFSPYHLQTDTQEIGVFCYLNENEMADNEEVAKKIRLMKRVIDRVYEGMEKQIKAESITLAPDFLHMNCEDSLLSSTYESGSTGHIRLVHIAGPTVSSAALGTFSSLPRLLINYAD